MGRRGGAAEGLRIHPPPHSFQQCFAAPGRLLGRPCAPWHETGLLLSTLSCMLNMPSPCRILQPSALLCCRGGGETAFVF